MSASESDDCNHSEPSSGDASPPAPASGDANQGLSRFEPNSGDGSLWPSSSSKAARTLSSPWSLEISKYGVGSIVISPSGSSGAAFSADRMRLRAYVEGIRALNLRTENVSTANTRTYMRLVIFRLVLRFNYYVYRLNGLIGSILVGFYCE